MEYPVAIADISLIASEITLFFFFFKVLSVKSTVSSAVLHYVFCGLPFYFRIYLNEGRIGNFAT